MKLQAPAILAGAFLFNKIMAVPTPRAVRTEASAHCLVGAENAVRT